MTVTLDQITKLRAETGAGISACKQALTESNGNHADALLWMRKKFGTITEEKKGRETAAGLVYSYIHTNNKIGVLLEVACESDFVARSEAFVQFVNDIALHIVASKPKAVDQVALDPDLCDSEYGFILEHCRADASFAKKPEAIQKKIVDGRMAKFYAANCLLDQPFVKDDKITVRDLLTNTIGKIKENIVIRRFTIYELGA